MRHPLVKRFVWILIFAVLVYAALVIWSGVSENLHILRSFPWLMMPLILGSVFVNFALRELKWDYYRRIGGIKVSRLGSFLVFFSGLSMAISPGRVGELIKPFMYKEYFDQRMRRTIPLVVCERISDLLGMIVLAALTIAAYMHGLEARVARGGTLGRFGVFDVNVIYWFLAFSAVFMIVLIWLMRQKLFVYKILIALSRYRHLRQPLHKARKLYFRTYPLLTVKNLGITTALATVSWSFECLALMMILHGVGGTASAVTFGEATFIFCMATIFGGFLFFLPGGIGGFETSTAIMLALLGVTKDRIVPAVFITRFSTLFFSVVLGFIFILITSARFHKRMQWDEFEHADKEAEL